MGMSQDSLALETLLEFYVEAGVDIALDETPHDRFAESAREREPPRAPERSIPATIMPARLDQAQPTRPTFTAAASADDAALAARAKAREAETLDELKAMLMNFEGCALKHTAKNLCFADGNPEARVMFVGEAPGADEDRMGLPFVGRSGQLLDRMLAAIGLDRTKVYIANLVPWRPPGNRTPTPQEAAICRPFIDRQIELCDPDIVVCLGAPSAQALLGIKEGILRSRGKWFTYETGTRTVKALATLHPAYLLRQPLQKRLAWRDFRALKKALADAARAP
jgi:uracil-DNA glycosylase